MESILAKYREEASRIYWETVLPRITHTQTPTTNPLVERFQNMQITTVLPEEPARRVPQFIGATGINDFQDDHFATRAAMRFHQLDPSEICRLGETLFLNLAAGISKYDIGLIFMLAFQLQAPGTGQTQRLFPPIDVIPNPNDTEYH